MSSSTAASAFPPLKNDLILRAARREQTERAPVWIMRQAGRYLPEFRAMRAEFEFFKVCRTPQLACEITLQPIRRFPGLDAAIIFSDILVVPQALGLEVQMIPGKGPTLPQTIDVPSDIDAKLKLDADVEGELAYVGEALRLTRMELQGQVPLIGFAGAPWTLMAYMIEGGGSKTWTKAQKWLYTYPQDAHRLLDIITQAVIRFLILQAKSGAQLLQVFDSWAGELSVDTFREFALPCLGRIATALKAQFPDIPLIVFARGANHSLKQLAQFPFDVVSLDWTADRIAAREELGESKAVQGNLNPAVLYASKEQIRAQVQTMVKEFGTRGHIANLGHGLSPDHDPEHVGYFIEAVHEFSKQS